MATNGQVNTNTEYESYFWVKWEQSGDQDIPNNRTPIAWSCGVDCGHSFALNAVRMSAVIINGVQVYGGGTYSDFSRGNHTIASGTLWVNHNTDGTKTLTISPFTGWLYSNHNYSSNGGSYSLTTIPRKATITYASDFTDQDNPSISFNNPGGFPLSVWLEPNPVGTHICERSNIPNTGTYTWDLTPEEREQLRNCCSGRDCTVRIGIYSNITGVAYDSNYTDYRDKKYTITENDATKPVVTMSVSLNNGSLPSAFDGMYIQGKSRVDVSISASAKYNAKIQSYSAQVDGKTYNSHIFTTDAIQSSGSVKVVGYAKDSREFTGSDERTVDVIAYSKPLVIPLGSENAIQCYRSDGNGNRTGNSISLWIKAKRFYYDVSGKNKCALQWRWKPVDDQWNDSEHLWNDLIPKSNTTTNEYNSLVSGVVFDLKKSYTVQIGVIDDIGEFDIKTFEIPTQDVALHLGKGGKNVAIGTYCDYSEERTFYSEWKAIFGGGVVIGDKTLKEYIKDVINGGG